MRLCPFCSYINGICDHEPDIRSYDSIDIHDPNWFDNVPHGLKHLKTSGAKLTKDFKLIPQNDSDVFDKTYQINDPDEQKRLEFWIDKIVCDSCFMNIVSSDKCTVISQLSENQKLFRIYMRQQKN